jgi:hypothetical protein
VYKRQAGASRATPDKDDEDFSEDLATNKFAKAGLLSYQTTGGETLFALQVKPDLKPIPAKPRDYMVMVDTSASQAKAPLTAAIDLTEGLAAQLRPADRIAIRTVNTPKASHDLTRGFKARSAPEVKQAMASLRDEVPLGNTDLKEGLDKAIQTFERAADRQQVVLFLGDGMSVYNPITPADRTRLCEEMINRGITFYTVPLGPKLDPKNLHGLATRTGGSVVRLLPQDKTADTLKRLQEALATPILYPKNFRLNAVVKEAFPTVLPPLRADAPTLVVGRLNVGEALSYTLEGTVGGEDVRLETSVPIGVAEPDNFFLVSMVEQWKNAKDEPALTRADRALAWAHDQSQILRADLIAQAEWAMGKDNLDVALEKFGQAKKLDPTDVEAAAGIQVVEKLKKGLLKKQQLKKELAQADKEAMVRLAQAGEKIPPPGEVAPPVERDDLLQQEKARRQVEEQRQTEIVDRAQSEARRLLPSDPDAAHELLKRTFDAVRSNPDLGDRVRQLLSSRLETALRNVDTQGVRIKSEREQQLKNLADARRRFDLDQGRVAEEERTRRRMLQVGNLMAQARYEDAYLQALAIEQDAISSGRGVPPAATAAYQVALNANNLSQMQELRRVRQERFLLTLMQVERSAVPFPDEPPIQFPPAATWREITRLRKERYESTGFTDDDPETMRSIKRLKEKLSKPISLDRGIDANTPLKDALEFLTDRYDITILVDTNAFKAEGQEAVEDQPVRLPKMVGVSLGTVLRLLTGQINGTYLIRRDYIEITTGQRAVAEKVIRVYPVADLVFPIPNSVDARSVLRSASILGTAPGLGLNLGGPQALGALGAGALGLGALGLGGALGAGALGLGGLGLGGLGIGGLGLAGGALGAVGGGLVGAGGQAGFGGGLGFGGGGQVNLGAGGGQLGFGGGQLGQFGNLGGQFGLQGGDQSQILIELIRQVVGNPREWQRPGFFQRPPAGALNPAGGGGQGEDQDIEPFAPELLNALGYFPPSRALVVKGTSRIHTNIGGGFLARPGGQMGALDAKPRDGALVIAPQRDRPRNKDTEQVAAAKVPEDANDLKKFKGKTPKPEELALLDPAKIWRDALVKGVDDPGLIIACADFLAKCGFAEHLAEFLKANLRQGIVVRPWVYETLALALEATQGSPAEIERARLSAMDLEPADSQGYVKASKAMADLKNYDRAVAFCRQAALLEPNVPQPYEEALLVAELAKDPAAMEWAAGGLLRQDWPEDNQNLHLKAQSKLHNLAKALEGDKRGAEAQRMVKQVGSLNQRDLVIQLIWQGDTDLDLEVKEPIGSLCSFMQRQTPGGGILLGDTLSNMTSESYVAAKAFTGEYQVTVRRIWGRPLGGKATLKIIQHQGTPQQTERWETFTFDRTHSLAVTLEDGRRTTADYVPPPTKRRTRDVEETGGSDRVLTKLRMIADPEFVAGSDGPMRGGLGALGLPAPTRESAARGATDRMVYQTKVASAAGNSFDLKAEATLTADQSLTVRLSPVFQSVQRDQAAPLLANPLLPGSFDSSGGR